MASFIQNSAVNSVGLEQQVFDFSDVGLPTQIPINPDVNGNNTFTRVSNFAWYGAALAQDGNIYAPPYGATQILGINTKTKKAFTIDVGAHTISQNDQTYGSFVAHPNGKLYATPMDAGRILEFDPINKTTSTFGLGSVPAGDWGKGIVAPNGYIYCVPENSNQVLKIDVYNRTVSAFGDTGYIGIGADSNQSNGDTGSAKFVGGVLVGDKIYMPPQYARDSLATGNVSPNQQWIVGIIDTSNDTLDVSSFKFGEAELPQIDDNAGTANNGGNYLTGNGMTYVFAGAVKGIDGKIYCLPYAYPYVCVIDPLNNTISRMNNNDLGTVTGTGSSTVFGRNDRPGGGNSYEDDSQCNGGVVAANGKIYAYIDGNNLNSPANNSVVEIDTENASWKYIPLPVSMDGELWDNTFWYPVTILGPDGGIYGIPYFQNYSTTSGDQGGNITYGDTPCVWHPPSASLPAPRILNSNQNGIF
tara:strand:- start:121 stop:1536 length:1416 start_codon:yes stop_codon:yes gene_type:complete